MAPLHSLLHSSLPRANIRLALDDDHPDDIEVKVYPLRNRRSISLPQDLSRSESKKPEQKTVLTRSDAHVGYSDEELYNKIWRKGSGRVDRLESVAEEFGRAYEWFEAAIDSCDACRVEVGEEQKAFRLNYSQRSGNVPDILPEMLAILEKSEEFFSQEGLKWPASLGRYRKEVWRDRESSLLEAFRSAFLTNGEESEHVRDMFYTFQCLLPGFLVLSHEDRCFSEKGTYRITRCLPPLAWVRRHGQLLLHIFPAKYRLCEQGLYHLGVHCATPESSLVLEFRPRIIDSHPVTSPLLPWKEGRTERHWRRQSFFS